MLREPCREPKYGPEGSSREQRSSIFWSRDVSDDTPRSCPKDDNVSGSLASVSQTCGRAKSASAILPTYPERGTQGRSSWTLSQASPLDIQASVAANKERLRNRPFDWQHLV